MSSMERHTDWQNGGRCGMVRREQLLPVGARGQKLSIIKAPATAKCTTFFLESSPKVAVVGQLDVPRDRKKPTNHIHMYVCMYTCQSCGTTA